MEILMKLKCAPTPAHKVVDQLQQQQQKAQAQMQHQHQQQQQQQQHAHLREAYAAPSGTPALDCCSAAAVVNLQWERGGPPRCCAASGFCSVPLPACCGLTFTPPAPTVAQQFPEETGLVAAPAPDHYEYQEPEENFVSIEDDKIKGFLMKIGQERRAEREATKRCQRPADPPIIYEIIDLDDEEEREKLQRLKQQAEIEAEAKKLRVQQQQQQPQRSADMLASPPPLRQLTPVKAAPAPAPTPTPTRQSPDISLVPKTPVQQQRRAKCAKLSGAAANAPLRIIAQIELLDSSSSDDDSEKEFQFEDAGKPATDFCQVMSDDDDDNDENQEHEKKAELVGRDEVAVAKEEEEEVEEEEEEEEDDDETANNVNDEDEDLPLAASAVSCELEYDDNDDDEAHETHSLSQPDDELEFESTKREKVKHSIRKTKKRLNDDCNNFDDDIVILASDDENIEFIDEHEEGLEVRWEELELEQRVGRNSFECFICGKKVQSNYNLRRHMMIHTGERPFGCDLCERRFREFSDLKKHRRRHANEPNFLCMVCRVNTPTECDPTRCGSCDSKNGALVALRSQVTTGSSDSTPEKISTPPQLTTVPNLLPAPTISITKVSSLKGTASTPPPPPPPPQATSAESTTSQQQLPPLTPINVQIDAAQLHLLDTIPPVRRSTYTKDMGLVTRKEFPCPLCQRPFGTRHNLKRHFMIHTGEKPFSCTRCRKPFREYSTLKKHMITHTRERWYKCLRCPQKFLDYLEYMAHKNSHPDETCGGSGSGAEDASASSSASAQSSPKKRTRQGLANLRQDDSYDSQDEDSSNTEDWLECCECGQRFTELETYTEHLKLHDAHLLFYECYVCKQSFAELPALERHMSSKHVNLLNSEDEDDEENFACEGGEDDGDGDHDNEKFVATSEPDTAKVLVVQVGGKRKARVASR